MNFPYVHAIVFLAALCGFAIAAYVRYKKTRKETLVCPIDFSCEDVIHSKYASVLGIPVEVIGLLYYGLLALIYGTALIVPGSIPEPINTGLIIATSLAMIFSTYLLFVQMVLKEWCSWCLLSFLTSFVIFYYVVLV